MQEKLIYSSKEGVPIFYNFIMKIIDLVKKTDNSVTARIDGTNVVITPEMVFIGTNKVVQILSQYKDHTRQ